MSFFRYPGGKSKLRKTIISKIYNIYDGDYYVEPFFGGGSIGLEYIKNRLNNNPLKRIWINDKDFSLSCLWNSVINNNELLKNLVKDFFPTVDTFFDYKDYLNTLNKLSIDDIGDLEKVLIGFKKLVIHQISYSGLGEKAGGPIGGKSQNSKYKVDCRWNPKYICKKIDYYNNLFSNIEIKDNKCTIHDFEYLIENSVDAFLYLDPPYFDKGKELYSNSFNVEDHVRLSNYLKKTNNKWILSYDDVSSVRDLYSSWANIEKINVNYSINGSISKNELIIYAKY